MAFSNNVADQLTRNFEMVGELFSHFTGEYDGYDVTVLHGHAIIDDGADKWIVEQGEYQTALDKMLQTAANGGYRNDPESDEPATYLAYNDICQECSTPVYSNLGNAADADWFSELTDAQKQDFSEACGEAFDKAFAFGR